MLFRIDFWKETACVYESVCEMNAFIEWNWHWNDIIFEMIANIAFEPYAQIFIVRTHTLKCNKPFLLPAVHLMIENARDIRQQIQMHRDTELIYQRYESSLVYLLDCDKYQTRNSFLLKYFAVIFGVFGFSSNFFSVLM